MHHFMLRHTDPKRHEEIDAAVTGPLRSPGRTTPTRVDPETGLVMPSWWSGDEEASRSAVLAAAQASSRG